MSFSIASLKGNVKIIKEKERMKVLFINVTCKSGSTGKIAYDLYSLINATGDEAAICYGRGKKLNEKNILKFGFDWETKFHALCTRLTGYTGCFSFFSTKRLIRFMKAFQPDVVHIHELHAYFVNIKPLLKYLKRNNVKTVSTLHCEFNYTGNCGHSVECEKWKTECSHCSRLRDYPKTLFFDHTKKMFRQKKKLFENIENLTVVAPSRWLAERAKESFLKDKKICVIPNGIDTESIFYTRDTQKLKEKHQLTDEKVILAVAPNLMSRQKGGEYVVALANRMLDKNVKFILIGITEQDRKFPSNVIALGRTENQNELAEYYSLADCFVICSERENFPTTCLEAQCCGTPICGFDVGGTKETAVVKENNFVPHGDVEALQKVVERILETNYPDLESIAAEKYSRKTMFEEYRKLYG